VFKVLSVIAPSSSKPPPPHKLSPAKLPEEELSALPQPELVTKTISPRIPTTKIKCCKPTQLELTGAQNRRREIYIGEEIKDGENNEANKMNIVIKEKLSHLRHEDVLEVKDGHSLLSDVVKGLANSLRS
jgi:hypothetical protein